MDKNEKVSPLKNGVPFRCAIRGGDLVAEFYSQGRSGSADVTLYHRKRWETGEDIYDTKIKWGSDGGDNPELHAAAIQDAVDLRNSILRSNNFISDQDSVTEYAPSQVWIDLVDRLGIGR